MLSIACVIATAVAAGVSSREHLWPIAVGCWSVQSVLLVALWWRDRLSLKQIVQVAVLLRLLVLWTGPTYSDDAWRYVWDGLAVSRGASPYAMVPSEDAATAALPGAEEALANMNSREFYSAYPPMSQAAFVVGGWLARADDSALSGAMVIKWLAAAAEMLALILLTKLLSPRQLLLYAWQPLVVFEAAGQGHTEAFALPLLVGTLLAMKSRPMLAGALLAGVVLVKLWPIVLLPLVWRRGRWRAVVGSAIVLALLGWPMVLPETLHAIGEASHLYTHRFEFFAGPYFWITDLVNWWDPEPIDNGKLWVGQWMRLSFVPICGLLLLLDWRLQWRLDQSIALILLAYFATATTVHPWYLLPILALPWTLASTFHWPMLWLSAWAMATYLRYPWGDGPYFVVSHLGWAGAILLSLLALIRPALTTALRLRAAMKARWIVKHLPGEVQSVLDLGCGEGFVGEALAGRGFDVALADAADFHRTALPFARYNGRRLPFGDGSFDLVVLYFVLHHAEDAEAVLAEALRVGRHVLVVESVYRTPAEHWVLDRLDRLANRLRSGLMKSQEEYLHFRTSAEWVQIVQSLDGDVVSRLDHGRPPHRQATLVVRSPRE